MLNVLRYGLFFFFFVLWFEVNSANLNGCSWSLYPGVQSLLKTLDKQLSVKASSYHRPGVKSKAGNKRKKMIRKTLKLVQKKKRTKFIER
jgi:hypothetical protein